MDKFDVTVIGSGPGGYVAAIRCAQLGFKTAIIERYNTLGGTCLNVGCIPSKAWLDSSEHYFKMTHEFKEHGINVENSSIDIQQMSGRVAKVVKENCDGVAYLMKKNKITVFTGHGTIKDKNTIEIAATGQNQSIQTDRIIIATGSKPSSLPGIEIDKERIITSTEALKLQEIPKHFIVIGGGVIGMELGSVFARLGSKVSVVEYMDSIIGTMDKSLGKELQKSLKKLGIDFYLKHKVTSVSRDKGQGAGDKKAAKKEAKSDIVTISAESADGKQITLEGDYCLISTGRRPYTDNLGLENVGIQLDNRGRISVNEHLETSVPGIYAIGDVIQGAMLAHKAEEEGVLVAETMAGQKPHINYNLIPGVVYTWPEVASVGQTEEQLKAAGKAYKVGSFPFKASGRARASMDTDGFVKVLADKETDEILGVHMIGARMADLIMEGVVAMEYRASAEDIARMSHPHPTYSEAFKEACLAATENRPIHI